MAKKTRTSLGAALNIAAHGQGSAKLRQAPAAQRSQAEPPAMGAKSTRVDRIGRVNVTGYFDPSVKASFRLIQAQHPDRSLQDLLAEALDDLFAKYNVPQAAKVR
jgi:hypothetical protein